MSFHVEKFYLKAIQGEKIDFAEMKEYLQSFQSIIIWGAGNLGKEIFNYLEKRGISVTAFWDMRYKELEMINTIPVKQPFDTSYNKEKTLIIFCIANVASSPTIFKELEEKGWANVLKGIYLYQGMICPLSKETPFKAEVCVENKLCTLCNCDKLNNIVIHQKAKKHSEEWEDNVFVDRVHFIINNFCNLQCTHCNRYMNTYPAEKRKNLDVEIVKYDIQRVMGAIASIGVVILFGGEPFLHLELDEIVGKVLEQENFGAILVNTNGIANMRKTSLENIKNEKVRVAFSNYTSMLKESQKKSFWENEDYLKKNGVHVQVQNTEPSWVEFPTLKNKNRTEEECIAQRNRCGFPYLFVYNHRIYNCSYSLTLHDLGVADYPEDYVDILAYPDDESLGKAILKLRKRPYLNSCSHCEEGDGALVKAAEQGFSSRYAIPK